MCASQEAKTSSTTAMNSRSGVRPTRARRRLPDGDGGRGAAALPACRRRVARMQDMARRVVDVHENGVTQVGHIGTERGVSRDLRRSRR